MQKMKNKDTSDRGGKNKNKDIKDYYFLLW